MKQRLKKKLTLLVSAAMLLSTASAFAQGTLLLTKEDEKLVYNGDKEKVYVLNFYLDGVLKGSEVMQNTDGAFSAADPGREYDLRICDLLGEQVYDANIAIPDKTPPTTGEDTKENESEYNPNNYPEETYDRAIDALYAFSVIDRVTTTSNDSGAVCYEISYANQGEIKTETIEGDITIASASDNASAMQNQSAGSLRQGDVVYFDRQINGTIKGIALIYRPVRGNILTDANDYGTNFEKLISDNGAVAGYTPWTVLRYGQEPASGKGVTQYAFGMSAYKMGNTLYLLNKSCNLDTAIEIMMKDKAAVYVCDVNSRVGGLEIESISAIGSNISKKQFNTGGTISPEEDGLSFVLVRLVDGLATDIVYYQY